MKYHLSNRKIIKVIGDDAIAFLQGITTNDMNSLNENNNAIYTCILTPNGRFLMDLFVIFANQSELFIDIADIFADNFIDIVKKYKLRRKVEAEICDNFNIIAYNEEVDAVVSFSDTRSPELPKRYIIQGKIAKNDSEEYNSFLISKCIVDGRFIQVEKGIILEYNFENINAISFTKGCYMGQELITRTKRLGEVRKYIETVPYDENLERIITHDQNFAIVMKKTELQ